MTTENTKPSPSIVLDLIMAFRRSKAMFAAVSLGIFDCLDGAPTSCASLAKTLNAEGHSLERLLDACVGLGLLTYDNNTYANTSVASTYLCSRSSSRLTGYINFSNQVFWKLWGNLEDAVLQGKNRWKQTFNEDGPIFDSFFRTEHDKREFLMGMHGYGQITSPHLVSAFDLSKFRTLVDLGGGTGHLAIAACSRYPNLVAKVVELPEAVPLAREIIAASDVATRIEVIAASFFDNELPSGDLFALARILHDWGDTEVTKLLNKIYDRLPPGGAILIAEKMLNEDKRGPGWGQMQNLNMLVCTEGKERTFTGYKSLLESIGFEKVTAAYTDSPLDFVLAVKPVVDNSIDNSINLLQDIPLEPVPPRPKNRSRISFPDEAEMYHAFFEQPNVGCVLAEMDGHFVLVNEAYAKIHGRTIEETLQLTYKNFTPIGYEEEDAQQIKTLNETGQCGPFEKQYVRKDRSLVSVRVRLVKVFIKERPYIWSIVEEIDDDSGMCSKGGRVLGYRR